MSRKFKSKRRGNNEGSIYQRKDGKWVGQVLVGYNPETGKRIRKYHYSNSREDVAHWIAVTLVEVHGKCVNVTQQDLLLKDFIHSWLSGIKIYEISSRTMELYYGDERNHIVPELGNYPVKDITTNKLQSFIYELQSKKNLSKRTIEHIRGTLVQMYDYAIEVGVVGSNPARNTKIPRQERNPAKEEEKVIPIELREKILLALENEPVMKPIIITLMFTGMRIGEVLALQWSHVDFQAKTIRIRQAVTQDKEFDDDGNVLKTTFVLGKTKTFTSNRIIRVPDVVFDSLKQWMKYVSKMENGRRLLTLEGFVFPSTRTYTMRTYSGFRATYMHFLQRHELDKFHLNLHRFRHTYASMLLEQDVKPNVVKNLLGHKDIRTTLGIYTHVVPEIYEGVADVMNLASKAMLEGTYKPRISSQQLEQCMDMLDESLWQDA